MFKGDHQKAQAAVELAVFGAILIFLLGTIARTAVGNSYEQNQNFKAMRMAMLASWNDSKAKPGEGASQITAHNSAQILFIEDRLAPDYGKYGDLDRTPYFASGSGTFSYNLLYPLSNAADYNAGLPIMDVYINGQHFPFAMASYVPDWPITPSYQAPVSSTGTVYPSLPNCPISGGGPAANGPVSQHQCLQNQGCRYQREWAGGIIQENQFQGILPVTASSDITSTSCQSLAPGAAQRECQDQVNACTIFVNDLGQAGVVIIPAGSNCTTNIPATGTVSPSLGSSVDSSSQWEAFEALYKSSFPNYTNGQINTVLNMVQKNSSRYKLFYTLVANPGENVATAVTPVFGTVAPTCTSHPCKDKELSKDVTLLDYNGAPTSDGKSNVNSNGVMQYDLSRNADYPTVLSQFPPAAPSSCVATPSLRCDIAWQWAATAGTTAKMIGLDASNNQYPSYDIDGRLKEVTVYKIWTDSGTTHVAYQDSDGGDIDGAWDTNSCGPKPGLQQDSQIYTFTKNGTNATNHDGGTYLLIKEGKLYNPETEQVVRSANKRDTIDLVTRTIQLSHNTHRFCDINTKVVGPCVLGTGGTDEEACVANPVEACVDGVTDTCTNQAHIAQTCYDTSQNMIFVRSRIEDRRGNLWMTNTTGQLKVH